jgi:predicted MPP superfamily phosphohydrolase
VGTIEETETMRAGFALFFTVFFLFYTWIQVYIGFHGWKLLKAFQVPISPILYGVLFALLAYSYFLSRLGNHTLPDPLYRTLHMVGAYWMGAMMYLFLFLLIFDVLFLIRKLLAIFIASPFLRLPLSTVGIRILGAGTVGIVLALLVFGTLEARSPRVTRYTLEIPKRNSTRDSLRAVFISDIHLGTLIANSCLEHLVDLVQSLSPDIVLLGGDVLDEDLGPFVKQNMTKTLANLKAPMGVYAIPGNHEYIGRHLTEFSEYLKEAGVQILIDETVQVADSFMLIGRNDRSAGMFNGTKRKDLSALLEGLNRDLPWILLDHQPYQYEEVEEAGVDLMLSGHTHRGQIWPNQYITRKVYELDYGYKKKGKSHFIVSSGYGTWGPPLRIGSPPEIVLLEIRFLPGR